jgi:hypothetical protein
MNSKLTLIIAIITLAVLAGYLFIRRDLVWTEEKVGSVAESEVQRICNQWNVKREKLINRAVNKEIENSWTVRYTDEKGEIWVEVAFNKHGGVETFTNLNDKVFDIERQLKRGVSPRDIKTR